MPKLLNRSRPDRDQLRPIAHSVSRWARISGQFDLHGLDDGDARSLLELFLKLRENARERGVEEGDHPRYLDDRDCRRYKRLVASAFGHEPDYFEKAEAKEQAYARIREIAAKARIPRPQPMVEEPGTTVLPPEMFNGLKNGTMSFPHFAMATFLIAQFLNGPADERIELEDDGWLRLRFAMPARLDPNAEFVIASRVLKELGEGNAFEVQQMGSSGFRVRMTGVLAKAFERRAEKSRRSPR